MKSRNVIKRRHLLRRKETLINAKSSSEKSKILSSTSKNVAKTYQNLVKYDEPHVKKKTVNDCFLTRNDNRKTRKRKNARSIQKILQTLE